MPNLLTCQTKQYQPVKNQDRPKDRQIEDLKPARGKAPNNHPRRTIPEFELRQSPNERSKLLILLRRERTPLSFGTTVFEPLILCERRIELWLQEGKEEVQKVDT